MTKREIEKCIEKLFAKLTKVETSRLIYKQLTEICGKGKQFEIVIKKSKCFWGLTIDSLKFSLIVELAKIYDEQKDVFGIKKLLNICSQNSEWFSNWYNTNEISHNDFINSLNEKYDSISEKRKRLKEIRDSDLVHTDIKQILNSELLYKGFTWGDLEDLIGAANEILNYIFEALTNTNVIIHFTDYDDVNFLIKNAYKGMQKTQQNF